MNSEGFRETFLRNDREGPTKAEMAGKKEAKQKAGPSGQTEKNREETESSTGTKNTSEEGGQRAAQSMQRRTPQRREARSTRKADNHAKEARSKEEAENHAKETRSTSRADSNRSNNSPRTGERSCVTAQDKRRKRKFHGNEEHLKGGRTERSPERTATG